MSSESEIGTDRMIEDPGGCHYLPETLVVRPEERQLAVEVLQRGGFDAEDATDATVPEIVGDVPTQNGQSVRPLGVIRMTDNPHRGAAYLAHLRRPIEASPVHGLGYEGHGGFMSGDGPGHADDLEEPERREVEGLIAVIDSGIADEDLRPWWMSDEYVSNEPIDREVVSENGASHGTFVSSILRKLGPSFGIAFAAARPDVDGKLASRHGANPDDPPTHELEVLGAVVRLVRRFGDEPSRIAALNLSLGAGRCGANRGFLLALRTALDMWRDHFGYDAPIFAAGGNSPSPHPVYPGAFNSVRSVAAADDKGTEVVWRGGNIEPAKQRPWITDVAPGVKIHGLSGASPSRTMWWSGSSFATAIATSQSVTGQAFEVSQARTHWRNLAVDYRMISGLEHS